jgi:tRNA modification GTPase
LAGIEASVDFSEEVGEVDRRAAIADLDRLVLEVESLSDRCRAGGLLRDGVRIAIVGQPNAGKSSLLNRILGRDRAIVTEIPGTTRDTLEEIAEIAGLRCLFVDTAGLRQTDDPVEAIGVQRAIEAARGADLVWFLYDLTAGWTPEDEALLGLLQRPVVRVGTKRDLASAFGTELAISARTGDGIESIFQTVAELVPEDAVLPDPRSGADFHEACEGLALAREAFRCDLPDDLASVGLRQAIEALGRITGEDAADDVLERVFSQFCIGK